MKSFSRIVLLLAVVAMVTSVGCGGKEPAPGATAHSALHVNDPAAVAGLPESAQLSDEEIANIRRVYYNVPPDIAVDRSNSERIDCVDCAVIVYGHVLRPPFYLTKTDKAIFINGYQWSPAKPFPEIWDRKRTGWVNAELERFRRIKEKCRDDDRRVNSRAHQIVTQSADGRHNERWIRDEFAKDNIPIEEITVTNDGWVHVIYTMPCSGRSRGFGAGEKMKRERALAMGAGNANVNKRNSQYDSLKSSIQDGRLVIMTTYFGPIEDLEWIIALLNSRTDDRAKLFRLEQKIMNADEARALFANHR